MSCQGLLDNSITNDEGNMSTLFDLPPKPRRQPRKMMHVCDAGDCGCSIGDSESHSVRFACRRCGHETDWVQVRNVTEGKRGMPCPKCNFTRETQ